MSVTTRVYGYLYKADGTLITTGKMIISVLQDFISIDGYKIAPFLKTATLGAGGLLDVDLVATTNTLVGSVYGQPYPLGVVYQFEFDPSPSDTSIAVYRKDGYWKSLFAVPHVSDTTASNEIGLGALTPATTSSTTASATYVLTTDPRMLTLEQKIGLTDGGNADDLHVHSIVNDNVIQLAAVTAPSTPSAGFCYIYATSSGITPNKTVTVWGKLENGSAFIIGSVIA